MRRVALVFALMLLQGCSHGQDRRDALAAKGQVQQDAPVKGEEQILIDAAPEKVWGLLSGIGDWSKWQTNVSEVKLNGVVVPGTVFVWKNGGTKITSRLALVEPGRRIAWTGTAMGAHAVHVWTLEEMPDGGTRVKTIESMDGFLLKRFYSSEQLSDSLKVSLGALKKKAEQ